MAQIRDIAEFSSAKFRPVLPDDSQVNPNVYGAELAYWLCIDLAKRGVVTSYPFAEDWGWFIEYTTPDGEFAVHCGNVGGVSDRWTLGLRRFGRNLFGRNKPPFEVASQLIIAIKATLTSDPEISALRWLYDGT